MRNKNLRVLVVSPDLELMGGVAETVRLLMRELEGRVDAVHADFGRRSRQSGFKRYVMPFLDLFSFASLLFRERFDVIHMNPSLNARSVIKELILYTLFSMFCYGKRVMLFVHGWERDFFETIAGNPVTCKLMRLVFNRAGATLVLAGSFRDDLIRIGVRPEKVRTVTTMVDMDLLPDADRPIHCDTLLYLSRIIEEKGVYEILDAYTELCAKYQGLRLIMAGDGPERADLMRIAAERGLGRVEFPGYIRGNEKFSALEKSCIFLLPTRYGEGCPVALLEAMGAGIVPVVADAGGISDVVRTGETALLLDEISPASISTAVNGLLQDEERRQAISGQAAQYASDHFSSGRVTEFIVGIYVSIQEESSSGE